MYFLVRRQLQFAALGDGGCRQEHSRSNQDCNRKNSFHSLSSVLLSQRCCSWFSDGPMPRSSPCLRGRCFFIVWAAWSFPVSTWPRCDCSQQNISAPLFSDHLL